jgi:hypothetical protein
LRQAKRPKAEALGYLEAKGKKEAAMVVTKVDWVGELSA